MTITQQNRSAAVSQTAAAVHEARVLTMMWEAEGVLSLEFENLTPGATDEWQPGAHLDMVLPNGMVRQYSVCSLPGRRLKVAVLRDPASRGGSQYIHENLRPGDVVTLRGPKNHFRLEPASAYRFLAGGIGITPILSMVRRAELDGIPWTLDYLGRSRQNMAFVAELESYGERVRIHADDTDGTFDLSQHLDTVAPGELAYACGPSRLMRVLEDATSKWPDPRSLHLERFAPSTPDATATPTQDNSTNADQAFTVVLSHGEEIDIPSDRSVLEALEDAGYSPLNSCREGICGTCETPVLEGRVDHRDSLLSDAEKDACATMMICVSRAAAGCPRLRLDLQ